MQLPIFRDFTVFFSRRIIAAGAASAMFFVVDAGAAIDLTTEARAAGPWEIALQNSQRRCGMQLRADKLGAGGYVIAMPAGCRRALPVLAEVGAWSVNASQALEFGDKSGKPLLSFEPGHDDTLIATGPQGESYELIATGRQRFAQASPLPAPGAARPSPTPGIRPAPTAPALPAAVAAPQRQSSQAPLQRVAAPGGPTAPVKPFSGRPTDLSGRYIIMREASKDVGCMLTLNESARGPAGSLKAALAPACRDNGIVVFDPLGWQLTGGKLALTARKGHKANFIHHEDGSWWKDPKEGGKPLGIKKM